MSTAVPERKLIADLTAGPHSVKVIRDYTASRFIVQAWPNGKHLAGADERHRGEDIAFDRAHDMLRVLKKHA